MQLAHMGSASSDVTGSARGCAQCHVPGGSLFVLSLYGGLYTAPVHSALTQGLNCVWGLSEGKVC